jgi:hypothetical protein
MTDRWTTRLDYRQKLVSNNESVNKVLVLCAKTLTAMEINVLRVIMICIVSYNSYINAYMNPSIAAVMSGFHNSFADKVYGFSSAILP